MMYPFMTLNDDTEITHSEMKPDGRVKVYIETPDEKTAFIMPPATFPTIPGKKSPDIPTRKWISSAAWYRTMHI